MESIRAFPPRRGRSDPRRPGGMGRDLRCLVDGCRLSQLDRRFRRAGIRSSDAARAADVNELHLRYLASPEWRERIERDILPWTLEHADLGEHLLEVGPGPGLTTDLLRLRVPRLTAVEIDAELADALAARLAGTNVEVVRADAADTGLGAGSCSS